MRSCHRDGDVFDTLPFLPALSFIAIFLSNVLNVTLMSIHSPDLAHRQSVTLAALFPLLLGYYAHAVLAMLPNTFIFKLFLLHFILWQAWKCAIGLDSAESWARLLGHQNADKFAFLNFIFSVRLFLEMMSPGGHLQKLEYRA